LQLKTQLDVTKYSLRV